MLVFFPNMVAADIWVVFFAEMVSDDAGWGTTPLNPTHVPTCLQSDSWFLWVVMLFHPKNLWWHHLQVIVPDIISYVLRMGGNPKRKLNRFGLKSCIFIHLYVYKRDFYSSLALGKGYGDGLESVFFLLLTKAVFLKIFKEGNHDAIICKASLWCVITTDLGFCITKQGLFAFMTEHSFNIWYLLHTFGCIYHMCKCMFKDCSLFMYKC